MLRATLRLLEHISFSEFLSMNMVDRAILISGGNQGALRVFCDIENHMHYSMAELVHYKLYRMNLTGSKLWVGYSDFCKKDIGMMVNSIIDNNPDLISTTNQYVDKHNSLAAFSRDEEKFESVIPIRNDLLIDPPS